MITSIDLRPSALDTRQKLLWKWAKSLELRASPEVVELVGAASQTDSRYSLLRKIAAYYDNGVT
jgi:hypothetical protein